MSVDSHSSNQSPSDDVISDGGSTRGTKPLQNVFRVSVIGKKQISGYHPRRSHKKSRGGCVICKKRRVKCDEQKPHCSRCQTRGTQCCYSSEVEVSQSGNLSNDSPTLHDPTGAFFSLSLDNVTRKIEDVLAFDVKCNPTLLQSKGVVHPMSTVAFHHFIQRSSETIVNPGIRAVMRTDVIRVAFTSDYLMYTILGVGMLHLNRVSPTRERAFAESYFWQYAIKLYQAALCSTVSRQNVDALLSSCMLMGVMTICPENFQSTDSWVLTNRPEAMNWLCLQSGLRTIIILAAPFIPDSIWGTVFGDIDKEARTIFDVAEQGRDGLDPALADLCEIDDLTTEMTSIYYSPLRMLTPLMKLERNASNAGHCASFMGRLECDFLNLLRKRDPPALIILAHWMGLMCLLSEWQPWIEGRIRQECVAICMYLENSTDARVLHLLRFAADACGYQLSCT